jgi:hypothetical protein
MNIKDRDAAELIPRTHAAILMAIAKGLQLEGKSQLCVDVLGVA